MTMGYSVAKPPSTAGARRYEQLIGWLSEYIQKHGLELGDRLPSERAMAAQACVSRSSVRQGVTALQAKGVVEIRHGDGTYLVRPLRNAESVETLLAQRHRLPEVMEARSALEIELARLAALRRTPDDLKAIDAAIDRMSAELDAGSHGFEGDAMFHEAISLAAHNRVMADLMGHLAWSLAQVRQSSLHDPQRRRTSLQQHRAIAEAIRNSDPDTAVRATRDHIVHVARAQPGNSPDWLTGNRIER